MSHDTDQQYGPRSNETAGSREVSFEQCDLLSLLLNYLFPRESAHVEESIMLRSLEQVWTSHEHDFRLIMEQRFNDHQRALHIWIGQRRKTSQLQMMIDRQPSAQTLEMVDRVLVMNDLRILQLKWKALRVHVHSQDSTPGDLLCSTFAIMTRTQGTEALFKEGLERLKETSPESAPPAGATSPPSSKLQPHLTHPTLPIATSAISATSASALAIAATALIILTTLTTLATLATFTILTILTIHALDRWLDSSKSCQDVDR
ncbi:predicted protein [Pyrenophora tritici-repentis Pt-1C-BFP]|uniref:Uncharacterized protein n=1 Tax=Pyrenophora tritici-repentis (strain Pt-1C-BFP) TaxID=426418 RepID=B2WP32_PYRTR|nr:uncharacterized protein PTRG_11742 [Pyrenophora tritici-repentis Pt-1C-BFP]EDU44792.1 predicted protein [Pyrenophora tritici-repentis Pt-1C-BFP]